MLRNPRPLSSLALRLIRQMQLGRYDERLKLGAVERPHYGYCVYHAAALAQKLGYDRISVLEFGVAGGNGLVNLEYHAEQVERLVPVKIEIHGFDTGRGLPKPTDYRDLPYHWKEGFFRMDIPKLQSRLKKAKLIIGDVRDTVKQFYSQHRPAPVAAIFFDLDYYSSTVGALEIFETEEKHLLPRVYCYFDDVVGTEVELYNDHTGVRLAIHEYNQTHSTKKLGIPYHLLASRNVEAWHHQIMVYHDFGHSRYNDFVSADNQQIGLLN